EAFGVVLLEAMSYGLPIVATNIPGSGVPWVNQHGISGFNVPLGNSVALADACNQILASDELRSRLSQGARQRFFSEFIEFLLSLLTQESFSSFGLLTGVTLFVEISNK
ncbi:glycosyltransferase, partial [bacterium]|nr:glycosyltransferase [bacterium]